MWIFATPLPSFLSIFTGLMQSYTGKRPQTRPEWAEYAKEEGWPTLTLGTYSNTLRALRVTAGQSQMRTGAALAGVAQLVGRPPINQKVLGLIANQGTCLGCGFGSQ